MVDGGWSHHHLSRLLSTVAQAEQDDRQAAKAAFEEESPPEESSSGGETPLEEEVVVTATRAKRATLDIPEKVNIISGEELERRGSTTVTSIMQYEAGIRAENGPMPYMENLSIRGLGGDRVLLTVDGVRAMTFGGIHGGGFNVDIGNVRTVEVIRGPASTLYGSRAVGGVVNIVTRTPEEMLLPGRTWGIYGTLASKTNPMSLREGVLLFGAPGTGAWQWQLGATREDAGYFRDSSGTVTSAGWDTTSVNGKILFRHREHRFSVSGTGLWMNPVLNDGEEGMPTPARGRVYLEDRTWKEIRQYGSQLHWRFTGSGPIRSAEAVAYLSGGSTRDYNDDGYVRSGKPYLYALDSVGRDGGLLTGLDGKVRFQLADRALVQWDLTVGASLEHEWYHSRTDKQEIQYASPANRQVLGIEDISLAFYPNTTFLSAAGYLLSEIRLWNKVSVIPGVRYDQFLMTPDTDTADFDATGFQGNLQTTSTGALSPRLGVVYKPLKSLALSAMVAKGFYMTGATTRYYNFYHTAGGGFYIQGNPDLEPERSWNYELGLKGHWKVLRGSLSAFLNDSDGFVDLRMIQDSEGRIIRRYENIHNVRIYGTEVELEARQFLWKLDAIANLTLLDGTQVEPSQGVGQDKRSQYPVVPWFGSATLRFRDRTGPWGYSLALSARAQGQQSGTILDGMANKEIEPPEGFWLMDVTAGVWWKAKYRLNLGVTNLLDRTYQEPLNRLSYSAPRVFFLSAQGTF
jgi:hemoglobin/transferrin/lactoferrin receptor protein